MLIDTHAHLTHKRFAEDLPEVLARAAEREVQQIIDIADDLETSHGAVAHARSDSRLFATVGVHPHHAKEWSAEAEAELRRLIHANGSTSHRVIAIGEIGLDYHYDFAPRDVQMAAFRAQIDLAKEQGLPVVVHCRESAADVLDTLAAAQDGRLRGVVHCFTEDFAAARRLMELGLHLGIGGIVTHRHSEPLREVVRQIGLDRVIVETDAPYLAPIPHRGKRNEPAFVRDTAEFLARLLGVTLEEVSEITTRNAQALFQLPTAL